MQKKITIVDYGAGNILNLKRSFEYLSINVEVTSCPKKIKESSYLILPGDGAFNFAITSLKKKKLFDPILEHVGNSKPLFGICLGMQLLMTQSEEFGIHKGLNIIEGKIIKIKNQNKKELIKVPSIGWSEILMNKKNKEYKNLPYSKFEKKIFYFIHSFKAVPKNNKNLISYYYLDRNERVAAIIGKDNVVGTQFHPEKSGKWGLEMIKMFLKL